MRNAHGRAAALTGLLVASVASVVHPSDVAPTTRPEPFTISVPKAVLDDLHARLVRTRFADALPGAGWELGTDPQYLKGLIAYWANDFDWRRAERRLNSFHNYRANVGGGRIHFVMEKGKGSNPIPLLLLHGWPSSHVQFLDLIPLLTDPAAHGVPDAPSFDVIVPSLPGFGFSDGPRERGMGMRAIGEQMTALMTDVLGYSRFAVRGSDIGGAVILQMALAHPEKLIGVHLSGLLLRAGMAGPDEAPSAAEQKFTHDYAAWTAAEMAYASLQSSKPQTLANALNDSPAGLASWIVEKFRRWGDTGGDVESRFSKDELLTNLTIYWATQTIAPSVRLYAEFGREQRLTGKANVPTAVLSSTKDMVAQPREMYARTYDLVRWNTTDVGGHFLEWEEPALVARDLREFFAGLPRR